MAPRSAKRRRRSSILLSDDNDGDQRPASKTFRTHLQREITIDGKTPLTVSPVKAERGKSISKRVIPKPSPKSSPEKVKKNNKPKSEPEKSKSLHNFFGKATEEERWRKKSETPDVDLDNGELGDAIEDDDLSDETLQTLGIKTESAGTPLDRWKPALSAIGAQRAGDNAGSLPSSQRFIRSSVAGRAAEQRGDHEVATLGGHRPWADRYGPSSLEELVVHKKKVADVQHWLEGRLSGRNNRRLLVLKGPAGSGKTTTLSLVARAMRLQLVSWHNPAVSEAGPNNSIVLQFEEFLSRGGRFGSLAFDGNSPSEYVSKAEPGPRVLVVEEFPATTLQSFRSVLLQFLAQARQLPYTMLRGQQDSNETMPPIVIIISETLLSSSTALADSFTAHRLLGPEILNHPLVTAMEFNPVAPTFVTRALDLVMKKEARDSRRRRIPGPVVIQKLAEMGDVRSAVNSLEFLCLRGGDGPEWSGTVAARAKKTSKNKYNVPLTEMEQNSLQLVCQRETTLHMFHAAGKIVHNKREDPRVQDTRAEPPPKPPDHLMHLYKGKASLVDIEALINETGTDIQTFISTLHENYILSCNGETFEDSFEGCSDILSTSDVLNPDSRPTRRGANTNPNASIIQANLQTGSSDALRQDEISFNVATRGLLFNLPYPVSRAGAPSWWKGDNFRMFYPDSLRIWKPLEECEGLVELFANGYQPAVVKDGDASGPSPGSGSGSILPGVSSGVASWQTRAFTGTVSTQATGTSISDDNESGSPPHIHNAKATLTLEILPYLTRILGSKGKDTSILERITRFKPHGFISNAGEESFEEDDAGGSGSGGENGGEIDQFWTTLTRGAVPLLGRNSAPMPRKGIILEKVDKLYISDDDIEDD